MQQRAIGVASLIGLVACSSNGAIPSGPSLGSADSARVRVPIRLYIPNRIGAHRAAREHLTRRSPGILHQLFIAANSAGIELAVYPHGSRRRSVASLAGNISNTSPHCTAVSSGRSCSFDLTVPPGGPYDFVAGTFDLPPAGGSIPGGAKQLGAAVAEARIRAGKANKLEITIGGVVARTLIFAPEPDLFHAIVSHSEPLVVEAADADGNTIATDRYVDANGNAMTIEPSADSNAAGTITFSPAKFSAPQTNGITLHYSEIAATETQLRNGFSTVITAQTGGSAVSGTMNLSVEYPAPQLRAGTTSGPREIVVDDNDVITTDGNSDTVNEFVNGTSLGLTLSGGSFPAGITVNSEGYVWYADSGSDDLGFIYPRGANIGYYGGFRGDHWVKFAPGTQPLRLANGPDSALWVTEGGTNAIARVPVQGHNVGTITSYPLPTENASPLGIAAGPDNAMWFTECATSQIGRIPLNATPGSGAQIKEFPISASGPPRPFAIVAGNDGALWFTDGFSGVIRRMTTAGAVSTFPIPSGSNAMEIAKGPDGALWFTEYVGKIGRILTTATPSRPGILEWNTFDGYGSAPFGITVGQDGSIYFTEYGVDKFIRWE